MYQLVDATGSTLIEVVVSLVIITTILVGALFIAINNSQQSQQVYYYAIGFYYLHELEKNSVQGKNNDDFIEQWLETVKEQLPQAVASIIPNDTGYKTQLCWNYRHQQCIGN